MLTARAPILDSRIAQFMQPCLMYMPYCIRMFNSIEDNDEDDDEYRGVYVQLQTKHCSAYDNKMVMIIKMMMMRTEVYKSSCTRYIRSTDHNKMMMIIMPMMMMMSWEVYMSSCTVCFTLPHLLTVCLHTTFIL